LLSAALTVVLLTLPLDYANLTALPLLLGVGVSFNIYFVMNWGGLARDARLGDGACGRVFGAHLRNCPRLARSPGPSKHTIDG
jgi:hypothetical protein